MASLGLTGEEVYDLVGLADLVSKGQTGGEITVVVRTATEARRFSAIVRIDTPNEVRYYQHGGILHYVLRQLLAAK